jgi:hypothetical protein
VPHRRVDHSFGRGNVVTLFSLVFGTITSQRWRPRPQTRARTRESYGRDIAAPRERISGGADRFWYRTGVINC